MYASQRSDPVRQLEHVLLDEAYASDQDLQILCHEATDIGFGHWWSFLLTKDNVSIMEPKATSYELHIPKVDWLEACHQRDGLTFFCCPVYHPLLRKVKNTNYEVLAVGLLPQLMRPPSVVLVIIALFCGGSFFQRG